MDITEAQIKKLKRKTIGIFRIRAIRSLDQIARALVKSGIASSLDEGKGMVPELTKEPLTYYVCEGPFGGSVYSHLSFRCIENGKYGVENLGKLEKRLEDRTPVSPLYN